MENNYQMAKELLQIFLHQNTVDKMISKNGLIKIYRVNPNIIRMDIKISKGENKL